MLIDFDENVDYTDKFERIEKGFYLALTWEAEYDLLRHTKEWMEFDHQWPEMKHESADKRLKALRHRFDTNTWFNDYGSCDSPDQFKTTDYYRIITESPHPFLIVFRYLTKADYGDRRWHKNGPHIGTQKPQCEHYRDEPEIGDIYEFHVYRKRAP